MGPQKLAVKGEKMEMAREVERGRGHPGVREAV